MDVDHGEPAAVPARVRRVLVVCAAALLAATVIGLVLLWPRGEAPRAGAAAGAEGLGLVGDTVRGTVELVTSDCVSSGDVPPCRAVVVRLDEGPDEGDVVALGTAAGTASLDPPPAAGDRLVLARQPDVPQESRYQVVERVRDAPLLLLGVLFAVAVVALGRWRGLAALLGLAVSLGVVVGFVLPALVRGSDPLAVASVGGTAVLLVVMYLAHGVTLRTTTAVLGTAAALVLTVVLARVFVAAASLSGLTSDEAVFVRAVFGEVDLRGLLLAGVVIGALGVLDDVTVTQVSAVHEVRRAAPLLPRREVLAAGMRVGRDHVAATVNTLVLAYAGASLPLLLVFAGSGAGLGEGLTSEAVAQEVVRTLCGSIGLVAAVPLTTALAALTLPPTRPAAGPPDEAAGGAAGGVGRAPDDDQPDDDQPDDDEEEARWQRWTRGGSRDT